MKNKDIIQSLSHEEENYPMHAADPHKVLYLPWVRNKKVGNSRSAINRTFVVGGRRVSVVTSWTEEKIKRALAYIDNNYTSHISRENLAASLDVSPNHMGKYFKIITGKRINEYINELRIDDAARMLGEQKSEKVITIAFSVGFESLTTFNRTFLRVMGVTPSDYRIMNGME